MKLMLFLKLVDKLVQISNELQDSRDTSYGSYAPQQLSTGLKFTISMNSTRTQLEVLVDTGYNMLVNLYYWQEVHSTLRNDNYLKICTYLPSFYNNNIHREMDRVLFKAPNTFPVLPYEQCFDEDVLEPLMFQLLTKYTENEVQSMVAVRYLCPRLTDAERDAIEHFPVIGLDFRALSFLSEQDILELIDYIDEVTDVRSTTSI